MSKFAKIFLDPREAASGRPFSESKNLPPTPMGEQNYRFHCLEPKTK